MPSPVNVSDLVKIVGERDLLAASVAWGKVPARLLVVRCSTIEGNCTELDKALVERSNRGLAEASRKPYFLRLKDRTRPKDTTHSSFRATTVVCGPDNP
jgi:hypothetical protein